MAVIPSPSADSVGAGGPEDEIEITPEMIEAGIEACGMWSLSDLDEWKAIDIYRQMERARRRSMATSIAGFAAQECV
jgi:hypothetical protein